MNYIIGTGGVGSWLAEAMVRLTGPETLTLVDGDTLEEKNLDRQLFTSDQIGQKKAEALASKLKCRSMPSWYDGTLVNHRASDWLLVCVDNNPARLSALEACDRNGCSAIFAANEVHSSEAYVYLSAWKDTPLDTRVYYPEIESDESGSPAARAIGCTGEAQQQNRQLVTANFMAAALAAHLFVVWAMERRKLKSSVHGSLPHRLNQNLTRNSFVLRGDLPQKGE